ncbi:MAG: hypothetical protein K2Y27_06725 [Xanthobacteraceae bacterium]|nr:hypothetical protein [Xanthobacteraceae bacterium]
MQIRLKHAHLGGLAAILVLAAPAAQAFTLGGEAAGNRSNYEVPKFDLEEQARNFRSGGSTSTTPGGTDFNTPFGKGTMEFGVRQGPSPAFGFGPGSMGPASGSRANRMDFERMVTPENLR